MTTIAQKLVPARADNKDEWPIELHDLQDDRERAFVMLYVANGGHGAQAAKEAGYECANAAVAASTAYRLLNKVPRISEAVLNYSRKYLRSLAPKAINVVKEIMDSSTHSDRLKAARTVLERTDAVVQKSEVNVNIKSDEQVIIETLKADLAKGIARELLLAKYGPGGLDYYMGKLGAIDADFVEVEKNQKQLTAPDDPDADMGL